MKVIFASLKEKLSVGFMVQHDKEVKRRIAQAWKAFWSIKSLSRKLRLEALSTCVFPGPSQPDRGSMPTENGEESARHDAERQDLQREASKHHSYSEHRTATKWKWGGHVARLNILNTKPELYSGFNVGLIEPCPSVARFLVFYITGTCTKPTVIYNPYG